MVISIIIINYNLSNEVRNCINSLISAARGIDYEIILVDNRSEDESILKIAEELSRDPQIKFTFLRTEKNIGFGNACNLAAGRAAGEWLFFLNPDTVIKSNIFPDIIKEFEDTYSDRGIFGLHVNGGKYTDYSAGLFPNYLFEIFNIILLGRIFEAFFINLKKILSANKKLKVQWVMGAALFIRKDLFDEIKGFDPDYFLYFEEMDLCKRVSDKGLPVTYLSYIGIDHLGSASSKKNYYFFTKMFYKGKLLFLKKHTGSVSFSFYKLLSFLTILSQMIFWRIMKFNDKEKSEGKINAFAEVIRNLGTPEVINNLPYKK